MTRQRWQEKFEMTACRNLKSRIAAGVLATALTTALFGSAIPTWAQTPVAGAAKAAPVAVTLPAQIKAYQEAILTAKVAGYLKSLPVDKGDRVKAGQLIADIEVPELLADRAQYKAQADVARADFDRTQQASKSAPDLVTPQVLDQARGKWQVAQAQLNRVDTLLRYARITAPFSGTITARYVDPGAFIPVPSASDQKSAAIVALMDFSRVRVQIPIPEDMAAQIVKGTPASFAVQSVPGKTFRATVTRVSFALDQGSKTMLAEIELPNPDEVLRPGMYATVQLSPRARTAQ
jgi:membrane fusion protein (multidrug efflux system)